MREAKLSEGIASRPLSHPISRRSKTRYRFAIKNHLEFSSRHPLTEKALVIFCFRAAVEATYCTVLSIRQQPNQCPGVILLIPEALALMWGWFCYSTAAPMLQTRMNFR
jgi:hypothetical protein